MHRDRSRRRKTALRAHGSGGRYRRPDASPAMAPPRPRSAATHPMLAADPPSRPRERWCDYRHRARGGRSGPYWRRLVPEQSRLSIRPGRLRPRRRRGYPILRSSRHNQRSLRHFQAHVTTPIFQCVARRNAAITDVQIRTIPDSTASQMDQVSQQKSSLPSPATRAAAFCVHLFTAFGAGIALIALLEAVREHWAAMFGWLGAALVVDALDGPIARRLDVMRVQPNWSGEVLDLVVDFVTYVFVPAYAIIASGLLLPATATLLGVVVSGALYFADRRMKAADNHFRGFPALWNAAAFYLFLLHLPPALSSLAVGILIVLTFVPFHVVHPVRVVRLRGLTLSLLAVWAVLSIVVLVNDFNVSPVVTTALCAIAAYIVGSDAAIRLVKSFWASTMSSFCRSSSRAFRSARRRKRAKSG